MTLSKLRVIINAQIIPHGFSGGVEHFISGLIHGLGKLTDGNEEYILVTNPNYPEWLEEFKGPNQHIAVPPRTMKHRILNMTMPVRKYLKPVLRILTRKKASRGLTYSDGYLESLEGQLVHFPYQSMVITSMPSIFNPHDILHEHFPRFFAEAELSYRRNFYPQWCRKATYVVAESKFVKNDLVSHYDLDPTKIFAIPRGAPIGIGIPQYETGKSDIRLKYDLPTEFLLYPAQTYEHKNHIRLVRALKQANDNRPVHLICVGKQNAFWPDIEKEINGTGMGDKMRFLGYVSSEELQDLYKTATGIIFPSLFEGGGFPVLEAFKMGKPLACSNIPPLREITEDAAITFDPKDINAMANAIIALLTDKQKREELKKSGFRVISKYSWLKTAKLYRALYRKTANINFTDEDRELLKTL